MKAAGQPCPKCSELFPAEYAMKGQAPQWKCNACGAGGPLAGAFAGREAAPEKVQQPKKHWRDARRQP